MFKFNFILLEIITKINCHYEYLNFLNIESEIVSQVGVVYICSSRLFTNLLSAMCGILSSANDC